MSQNSKWGWEQIWFCHSGMFLYRIFFNNWGLASLGRHIIYIMKRLELPSVRDCEHPQIRSHLYANRLEFLTLLRFRGWQTIYVGTFARCTWASQVWLARDCSEWLSNLVHSPKTSLDKHKTWYTFLVLLFISCFPDNAQNPETFRKASWRLYWKDAEIRQRVGPCWTQGYPRCLLFFGCFFFMRWCLVFSHLFALICVSPMFFR